jgi:anti-sigma-K factor RskA
MHQDDPALEQRLARFEAQLDRFGLALTQWHAKERSAPPAPTGIDDRIKSIENTLDREAHALRQLHEEPLKQLQEQAASLKDLCVALQSIVTDLQVRSAGAIAQNQPAAWPLERVVHLHDELRRAGNGTTGPAERRGRTMRMFQAVPEQADATAADASSQLPWLTRRNVTTGAIALAVLLIVAGVARWIEVRLNDASARVASAEQQVVATTRTASQEIANARKDADRQIAEAQKVAQRAETVGSILTAPDLIRFNLTSPAEDGSSAQLLWSRTRGLVLSGSRLPAAPPESTYQLWLVTSTQSVGAGLFVPDAAGRASLVNDIPPRIPGAVVGAAVTIEPNGGRLAPSGRTLLARFP